MSNEPLNNGELLSRCNQLSLEKRMKVIIDCIKERLEKNYQGLRAELGSDRNLGAYSLIQRTTLEKPEIKKSWFGLIERVYTAQERILIVGGMEYPYIKIKVNDKEIISIVDDVVANSNSITSTILDFTDEVVKVY